MTKRTEFFLELKKLRHRWIFSLFFAALALLTLWLAWCLNDFNPDSINDVSPMLFLNLLLMNTILCPVMLAAVASRMCDMEQLGNTYKWLCTIQKPEHIYRGKVLVGSFCLACFCAAQTVVCGILLYLLTGKASGHGLSLFADLFLTSMCVFIFQLNLSLKCVNQLTPIFVSIGGTFIGLFSWFLNQWPLRYLIPWGYYAALCNAGYDYDEATRYTTCYWTGFPILWAILLVAATAAMYLWGKHNFLKTVRETM